MNALSQPPISIIVPNFNGAQLLSRNLPTVLAALAAYPGGGELIVVDDGSADDSVALMQAEFPEVKLVVHPQNRGFSNAIRSGVDAACNESMIFLNSDVQPRPDFIAPLTAALAADDVFSAAPMIERENGACDPNSLNCYSIKGGRLKRLRGDFSDASRARGLRPSLYASGGSIALKKSRFLALDGFLAIYHPFYWEDFDLGVRAWRLGWRTVSVPGSAILHQSHGSIKQNVKKRRIRRALQRNKLLVEWIHLAPSELPLFLARLLPRILARTFSLDFGFWGALYDALARLPEARRIRRRLGEQQAKPFAAVLRDIEAQNRQLFQEESSA